MSDEYQIEIPPSFYALYTDARRRLTQPLHTVRERYEACEDLANHLVEHAKGALDAAGVAQDEVLTRIRRGLCTPESGVSPDEATWVARRLAELLYWECPSFDADPS
jgi:hypothetical protein